MSRTIDVPPPTATSSKRRALSVGLWVAQGAVAAVFVAAGFTKFTTSIPELSVMMPWTGQVSASFVRFIGIVDMAGGLGVLLPSLTRILPRLTVLAASCCAALQVLAFAFHASRGEFDVLPLNVVLLALTLFIVWGRRSKLPIAPRT